MNFNNIYNIAEYFKINSTSHSEILELLKKERNNIHPDKNGGNFNSVNDEKKYHDLNDAIEWIENNSNNQLITINQMTELIKAFRNADKIDAAKI